MTSEPVHACRYARSERPRAAGTSPCPPLPGTRCANASWSGTAPSARTSGALDLDPDDLGGAWRAVTTCWPSHRRRRHRRLHEVYVAAARVAKDVAADVVASGPNSSMHRSSDWLEVDGYDFELGDHPVGAGARPIYPKGPWNGSRTSSSRTLAHVDWFNNRRLHDQIIDGPGYTTPTAFEADYNCQYVPTA